MSPAGKRSKDRSSKEAIQLELIRSAYAENVMEIGIVRDSEGRLDFIYQQGVILVRDERLDQVRAILGGGEVRDAFVDAVSFYGVSLYSLAGAETSSVPQALDLIDSRLGVGVATPHHILSIWRTGSSPGAEPEEVPAEALPDPGVRGSGGAGVLVYVIDTGLVGGASGFPWLAGVGGETDPLPEPDANGVVSIGTNTGHGTFAAGVIRCMAPEADVYVSSAFGTAGAISEWDLVRALDDALRRNADVICLPSSTWTRKDLALLSFEAFEERRLRNRTQVAVVAAAGDGGRRGAWWPARFQWVIGVGALDRENRGRAAFSNHGDGINLYAPGTSLVNAFASGTYVCRVPPHAGEARHFTGMARWSGTSFAASVTAGLIAARISKTGENGRQAADSLLTTAQVSARPGVGPVLLASESAVFISYRREDTAYAAGWLYDRLAMDLDEDQIFKDVDSIRGGDDFAQVITLKVGSCDALLALVGQKWLTITDENHRRRLDNPADFVRLEIEAALNRGIPVIPVLVDGAKMPRASQLPPSLAGLLDRQAVELRANRFHSDTDLLREAVGRPVPRRGPNQERHD
jgi:hypothetical protein